jgi:hypothetical protein
VVLGTVSSTAHAVDPPDTGVTTTVAPPTPTKPACNTALAVTLGGHSVAGSSVTVNYTITGCAGSVRLHIHQNLLAQPTAGSDPQHQSNVDFMITKDSATSQTVPLLAGVEGECFVQVDYSTPTQRKGFFVPTESCPAASSTSVAPSSSTPVTPPTSSSVANVSTSASAPSTSSSAAPRPVATSSQAAAPVAQIGPIPQTGFGGDVVTTRSHPYRWATVPGVVLFLLGLAGLVRLTTQRRREPTR